MDDENPIVILRHVFGKCYVHKATTANVPVHDCFNQKCNAHIFMLIFFCKTRHEIQIVTFKK